MATAVSWLSASSQFLKPRVFCPVSLEHFVPTRELRKHSRVFDTIRMAGEKSKVKALGNLPATFAKRVEKVKAFSRVSHLFSKKEISWCRVSSDVLRTRIKFNFKSCN